jgi:hypothetical protein
MKQNRQIVMVAILAFIVCVGGPFTLARGRAKALDQKTANVKAETKAIKAQIETGKSVKRSRSQYDEMLKTVRVAMPADNDLRGGLNQLHELADASGLVWQSVTTSEVVWTDAPGTAAAPAASGGTDEEAVADSKSKAAAADKSTAAAPAPEVKAATVPVGGFQISVEVQGPRDSVLNYLKLIRTQPNPVRLFVVSGLKMAYDGKGVTEGSNVSATITLKSTAFGVPDKTTAVQGQAPATAVQPNQTGANVAQPAAGQPVSTVAPPTAITTAAPATTVAPQQQTSASTDPPVGA